ncbi:MAG: phosphoribosylglycinamide formyltransferase [Candidatus Abyssobacteria bacterium SURF_5]|uniref:Phosphoribosylglycinamide formyltransferase n=1 Tax=Abyssobacteria bacterium (strain SURF_5) TaxID=2093360 RepID=A0A3A4NGQ0_ABYX5|nr:MAG: phosphoribosylglycinamide formyltransferase [Candidatus Abyssubacteria bacterium SURF_5]
MNRACLKIGVLGSGTGTNLQSIIDAVAAGRVKAKIACVISDVQTAFILERARKHGVDALYVPPGKYKTRLSPAAEADYIRVLKEREVELVVLAGFMRMLKGDFLEAFPNRVINIHPSILPAFRGLEAWKQALDYGVKFTGCTVHFVELGMDTGPIIMQAVVEVKDDDTPQTLHQRIQVEEHRIYPEVIRLIAEGRVEPRGRRVFIR